MLLLAGCAGRGPVGPDAGEEAVPATETAPQASAAATSPPSTAPPSTAPPSTARPTADEPLKVRGLRLSGEAAGDPARFRRLLDLANSTAVNTLVFDTKQEGGRVLYDTAMAEAGDMGAVDVVYDPAAAIAAARERGLHTITRIAAFEDRFRARAHPEERLAGPWVDPGAEGARGYNIALAVEACEIGFDEIQFDYVRFPAGRAALVSGQLQMTEGERVGAVAGFLAQAREALQPLGCAVSADVLGMVASMPDDQGIGQRLEEISAQVGAVSPMVYPSHYAPGWLGFADPNNHPYDVTAAALDDALLRLAPGTRLRPWLQAFRWDDDQIRASIQAAEDRGVGWMLWNVASNFDGAALPSDDEVSD